MSEAPKPHPSVYEVGTPPEIARMWGVTRAAVSIAIERKRLPARQSVTNWLIAFSDAVEYFGREPKFWPKDEAAE